MNPVLPARPLSTAACAAVWFMPGAGKEAACVTASGDYAFTGGWKTRGQIWVNRLSDGTEIGMFDPGETVGGVKNTGWIDLLAGINAFKRGRGTRAKRDWRSNGARTNISRGKRKSPAMAGRRPSSGTTAFGFHSHGEAAVCRR